MTFAKFLDDNPEWNAPDCIRLVTFPPSGEAIRSSYPDADLEVCQKAMEYVKPFVTRGALYIRSRRQGNDDRFAAIAAMQRPGRGMTDDVFFGGYTHWADVYGEDYFNTVKAKLAEQGVNLTANTQYMPELAQYVGDPRAVISGRGDIQRRAEELGVAASGAVTTQAREPEVDPYDSAPALPADLQTELAENFARDNPDEARKMSARDVVDHVTEQHGTHDV